MKKTLTAPVSDGRPLKTAPIVGDTRTRDQAEESDAELKAAERARVVGQDKVSNELGCAVWIGDRTPSQVWRERIIEHYKGDTRAIPRYTFERHYHTINAIIDRFWTDEEYEEAGVEERRKLCHAMGTRYAALGLGAGRNLASLSKQLAQGAAAAVK